MSRDGNHLRLDDRKFLSKMPDVNIPFLIFIIEDISKENSVVKNLKSFENFHHDSN